ACAFKASSLKSAGISDATTEMTYCSNGTFSTSSDSVRWMETSTVSSFISTDVSSWFSVGVTGFSSWVQIGNFTITVGTAKTHTTNRQILIIIVLRACTFFFFLYRFLIDFFLMAFSSY